MSVLIMRSRRAVVLLITAVVIQGPSILLSPGARWAQHWVQNRATILLMTAVNTSITTASEVGARSVFLGMGSAKEDGFFVPSPNGGVRIHRQSLTNILMTLFASLLGGPVFFISTRARRFVFFSTFGILLSIFAQGTGSFIREGMFFFIWKRLFFDLIYNSTFKFSMFELTRPTTLRVRHSWFGLGSLRIIQDFLTTLFRVAMLNLIGFRG